MRETSKKVLFWALMFFGAFLLLTQVGYSDGDDAFFYQYTHEMGFFEYLSWRYQTWVGRMSGEAMVYIAFSLGIWFWRIVNAMMLVLLPCGVLKLAEKAAGIRTKNFLPGESVAVVSGYLLMAIMTVGYAAIWINGSIFYTWSFTCGIWALVPVADIVFDTGDGGSGDHNTWHFFYSIPCAVLASMSIEQMAAVLVTFEVLAVLVVILRKHEKQRTILLIIQTAVTVVAFVILFLAPGNDIRVASEVQNWMPQYEELSFGEHLFVTVQWLVSSFANENRLLLFGIWLAGILHIICKKSIRCGMYDGCRTVFCSCITAVCRNQGVFRLWSSYRRYYSTAGAGTADRRDAGGKLVCNVLVDRGTFVYLYLDMESFKT